MHSQLLELDDLEYPMTHRSVTVKISAKTLTASIMIEITFSPESETVFRKTMLIMAVAAMEPKYPAVRKSPEAVPSWSAVDSL